MYKCNILQVIVIKYLETLYEKGIPLKSHQKHFSSAEMIYYYYYRIRVNPKNNSQTSW